MQQPENHQPDMPGSNSNNGFTGNNTAALYKRVLAAIIDLFIVNFCVSPLMYAFKLDVAALDPLNVSPDVAIKILGASLFVFFMLNGFLLATRGQTLGKRLFNIAIVDLNNQPSGALNLLLNRYLIQVAMIVIPLLNFADVLLMFVRTDRRCLHDLIARTKVIDLNIKVAVSPNSFIA